ncbi:hypothetical protein [Yoonia sp. SS1-5]|uniref:Uncharacterized protein n=1 Tax=Yoonia rhodophyticola TaxID=3137370 RepID=A0AAN0NL95_9RHOB
MNINNRVYLIWVVLPIAPLIVAFTVLGLLDPGEMTLLTSAIATEAFHDDALAIRFHNQLLVYGAVAVFHVAACLAIIISMMLKIRQKPLAERRQAVWVLGISIALLVAFNLIARQDAFRGALNLTYREICAVSRQADIALHILPPACDAPGLSIFAWLAVIPYLFGLLAAAFASSLVSTLFVPLPEDPSTQEVEAHKKRITGIEQAFQSAAFVLVTSTIAMMLFYKLPLSLMADEKAHEIMTGYAQGMTLFWGMIFTLTLIAIFGPGNLILSGYLTRDKAVPEDEDRSRGLLAPSTRDQLSKLLTALVPLLIGAAAPVLELITGAL